MMGKYLHATIVSLLILSFSHLNYVCHSTQIGYTKTKSGSRSKLDLCYKNLTILNNSQVTIPIHKYSAKYCLGTQLPYRTTIVPDYLPDIQSIDHISYYLEKWEQFQYLPKCWHNLQLTLCSIFIPQLDEDPSMTRAARVSRPSVDSCNNLVNNPHCKFIANHYGWPSIFNCSDSNIYAKNCSNEIRDFRFNRTLACLDPLVPSNDSRSWFKDISGCTMHCKYPISDNKDQENVKYLIGLLSITGFFVTLIALLIMDKSSKMLQAIGKCILFQPLLYLGWSLQTILGRDIACSSSGASLYGLPIVANACVLSFILTYSSMVHFLIWYAYMGEICYRELRKEQDTNKDQVEVTQTFLAQTNGSQIKAVKNQTKVVDNKVNCNETRRGTIVNWMSYYIPVILFIAVAFLGQIDGNGIYGICTVGQKSILMKSLFVFTLDFICTTYGNIFLIRAVYFISKKKDLESTSRKSYSRIFAIIVLSSTRLFLGIGNHLYAYYNRDIWEDSIDRYISCKLNPHLDDNDYELDVISRQECELNMNYLAPLYYLELFSTLGLGMLLASWAYCDTNFVKLKRMIIKMLETKEDQIKRDYLNLLECGAPTQMDMFNQVQDQSRPKTPPSLCSTSLTVSNPMKKCGTWLKRNKIFRTSMSSRRENILPNPIGLDYFEFSRANRDRELPLPKPPEFYFSIDGTQDNSPNHL